MSAISLIQPDRDLFPGRNTGLPVLALRPFYRCRVKRWINLAGIAATLFWLPATPMSTTLSFGMAICGRMLEAQGFRVGIISQPDWNSKDDFMRLGKPNLFFGVTAGNMDSMINRYTADRKLRHDDACTAGNVAGKRPDRATLVYTQRCKRGVERCAGDPRRHRSQPASYRPL